MADSDTLPNPTADGLRSQPVLLLALTLVVAAAAVATHWPVLSAQAKSFDDHLFLTDNQLVRKPSRESVGRFFGEILEPSTVPGYYLPLSMTSLMLDYQMGGRPDDLRVFHRTSLALHAANVVLVIILMYELFGSALAAACAGLVFGLHPLTVEPIAWIGERKTLLATFFSLGCLLCYVRFVRRTGRAWFAAAILAQLLALLSKPTATPLPLLLVLLDYWPLGRLRWRTLLEKAPFFALSVLCGAITLISHARTAGIITQSPSSFWQTPLVVCHLIVFYAGKLVCPARLSSIYPLPKPISIGNPVILLGVIGFAVLVAVLVLSWRRTRAVVTGSAFFFIAILPTLGLVQYSWVTASDKYVYLPAIGPLMVVAWALSFLWKTHLAKGPSLKAIVLILVLLVAVAEAQATRGYLARWTDTITHARYMLALAPGSAVAHNHLGDPLGMKGQLDEAIAHFREALRIQPDYAEARSNLGTALRLNGDPQGALPYLEQAVRDNPRNGLALYNLGLALQAQGRFDEAAERLREAARLRPDDMLPLYALGQVCQSLGDLAQAAAYFRQALELSPHNTESLVGLAGALSSAGKVDDAMGYLQEALRINPSDPDAQTVLGGALASQGKLEEAVVHFQAALAAKPDHEGAHYNMGLALQSQGRIDEAISHYQDALRRKPEFAEAHHALGLALVRQGHAAEGLTHFREAMRLRPNWALPVQAAAQLMATASDPAVRREKEAVPLARLAAELTRHQDARVLDTLAQAYAAAGDFNQAASVARQALVLATASKDDRLAAGLTERLRLYEQRARSPGP